MGIKVPVVTEIAKHTYAINEFGMATAFLLVGKKAAMLIDTGVSVCDLKGIIAELTQLPYYVVLSHGHGDHAGGAAQFNEVYVHSDDFVDLLQPDYDKLRHYVDQMGKMGSYEVYDVKPEDMKAYPVIPLLKPLYEDLVFDLGGRKVSVVETPGHTPGSCSFIDDYSRILFSGDACNINLGLSACSVTTALRGLKKLKSRANEFDRNYNSHIGYAGRVNCFSMPDSVLDSCIKICEDILSGTADAQPNASGFGPRNTFAVHDNGVKISFNPDRLIDPDEKPA